MSRPKGSKNGVHTYNAAARQAHRYATEPAYRERVLATSKRCRDANPLKYKYKRTCPGWGINSEGKRAASRRKWIKNNRPASKESKVIQRNNIRLLRDELKAEGCSLCGYVKCLAAIEFHHISDDKEHLVGRSPTLRSLRREASKCIVVCANCHREIHAGQIEGYENVQRAVPVAEEPPLLRLINRS